MMSNAEPVTLNKEVDAILIPDGTPTRLKEGDEVAIMQVLGGMFTVRTVHGYLVRIDGTEAEALGQEIPAEARRPEVDPTKGVQIENVWDQLRTCYDPEIPVNIVELGLVYKCELVDDAPGQKRVEIEMTLTAPGCGMGEVLKVDIERKVSEIPGISSAFVELVFDPPWDPSMMSESARLELGFF